jgi:hypothetical protein
MGLRAGSGLEGDMGADDAAEDAGPTVGFTPDAEAVAADAATAADAPDAAVGAAPDAALDAAEAAAADAEAPCAAASGTSSPKASTPRGSGMSATLRGVPMGLATLPCCTSAMSSSLG